MSYSRAGMRLCQAGAGCGLVTALTLHMGGEGERKHWLGQKFAVFAKSRDLSQVNNLSMGMGIKWDSNWDHRYYKEFLIFERY